MPIDIQIPILFYVLAFWLGSSLMVGCFTWIRDASKGLYDGHTLWHSLWPWLGRGLLLTILSSFGLSIFLDTYDFASLLTETLMLAFLVALFFVKALQKQVSMTRHLALEVFENVYFLIVTVSVWAVSLGVGYVVVIISIYVSAYLSTTFLSSFLILKPFRDGVMVVGFLWLVPYLFFYRAAMRRHAAGDIDMPKHFKFYKLLWPILLALIIFAIPLFLDSYFASDKYKELTKPRTILRII